MRLPKRTQYAVAALVHLARLPSERYVQSKDLARAEALPGKYVELVLMALRRADLLVSRAGVGGGYRLSRPPGRIRLADVIEALQQPGVARAAKSDDDDDRPRDARSPGRAAVAIIHQRLEDVTTRALGGLTLEQLLDEIPKSTQQPAAMYYI